MLHILSAFSDRDVGLWRLASEWARSSRPKPLLTQYFHVPLNRLYT